MAQPNPALAFSLKDFPFSPNIPLPGMRKPVLIGGVETLPLRIDEEEALQALFSSQAGPFDRHLTHFQNLLKFKGYSYGTSAGFASLPFAVAGPLASGKSTLVNRLVAHVKGCRPPESPPSFWKIEVPWRDQILTAEQQLSKLADLNTQITKTNEAGDHCCVVLDNLAAGVADQAANLFAEVREICSLFLFVTAAADGKPTRPPSPDAINIDPWDRYAVGFTVYRTEELSPTYAVQYVKDRISYYRKRDGDEQPIPPHLAQYPLFPFSAEDIASAIAKKRDVGMPTLDLRQLNRHLSEAIRQKMLELRDTYDINKLTLDELAGGLISIAQNSYERMKKATAQDSGSTPGDGHNGAEAAERSPS
jgi:hypothetical protein